MICIYISVNNFENHINTYVGARKLCQKIFLKPPAKQNRGAFSSLVLSESLTMKSTSAIQTLPTKLFFYKIRTDSIQVSTITLNSFL